MKKQIHILAAAVVLALAPALQAQITPPAPSELNSGQNLVATKIANNFTNLAGGEDNALALVNALRAGGEVTLVTTVPPPAGSPPGTLPTTTETTFDVPTKPMGWGNVKHALALAQDQLQRAGITNPTGAQLQTALTGGDLVRVNADGTTTTTTVKGILTLRAGGMGWGNIAKEGGTKLGHVQKVDMSAKSVKAPTTTTTTTTAVSRPRPAPPRPPRNPRRASRRRRAQRRRERRQGTVEGRHHGAGCQCRARVEGSRDGERCQRGREPARQRVRARHRDGRRRRIDERRRHRPGQGRRSELRRRCRHRRRNSAAASASPALAATATTPAATARAVVTARARTADLRLMLHCTRAREGPCRFQAQFLSHS
jgi:hypothetical protein